MHEKDNYLKTCLLYTSSILQTMREQGEKVQTEPEKKAPSGRDAER